MTDDLRPALASLGHPDALRLLRRLEGGSMTVNEIVAHLDGPTQPRVSQHLGVLKDFKAVRCRRDGMYQRYSITETGRRFTAAFDAVRDLLSIREGG